MAETAEKPKIPSLDSMTADEKTRLDTEIIPEYLNFLDKGKISERVVTEAKRMLLANGFVEYSDAMLHSGIGDAEGIVITDEDGLNFAAVKFGKDGIAGGFNLVGAHNDSPCLETKPHPLKQTLEGVLLDTNYYGGIVTHQMVARKYNIVGSIQKENGEKVDVDLRGVISDPAPHISRDEKAKNEDLDVFTGHKTKDEFLKAIGGDVTEDDIAHSRLYCTPDTKPEVMGDHIVAYGHDDRICVYSMVRALIDSDPEKASIALGIDREEIGSTGYSGAKGHFFEKALNRIVALCGGLGNGLSHSLEHLAEDQMYENSKCLSADVTFAADDRTKGLIDIDNNAKYGHGVAIVSHGGSRGKYDGNFVSTKFMNEIRSIFKGAGVVYQIEALPSKVDQGGGGTIAKYFSERGIKTIDAGVPLGGMHSPEEIAHKGDLFQAIKAYKAFFESK